MESWKDIKIGTKCSASNWDGSGQFNARSSVGKKQAEVGYYDGLV